MKRIGRWFAGSVGALGLVVVGIVRFANNPDLLLLLFGIAAAVALVGIIVLGTWLPSGLSLREARQKSSEELMLAAGDHSIAAAASTWRSTDLVRIPRPSTYVVLEFADDFIGIWAGGLAAERIATIPASAIVSVTREHGPFRTTSPIPYLSIQLRGGTEEIRFVPGRLRRLTIASRIPAAEVGESLAARFAVPLVVSESMQT